MKTIVTLALVLFANVAQASNPAILIEAQRFPGFERNPQNKVLRVDSAGTMTLEIHHRRENRKEVQKLGRLTADGVKKIQEQLSSIAKDSQLVDENAGQPMCTDIPSFSTKVLVEGELKEISRSASCHHWSLEGNSGKELAGFAKVLLGW